MKPFVSIIVACCDVEPFVRECLDSVLTQPFREWECLVGVETSEDDTEAIVREYAAKDSRFKVFTGPRSGSCSASRNFVTALRSVFRKTGIFSGPNSMNANSTMRKSSNPPIPNIAYDLPSLRGTEDRDGHGGNAQSEDEDDAHDDREDLLTA